MTWTAPMTAVSGSIFTAAQYNTYVRDNFLELGVAQVSAATGLANQYLVNTGLNSVSPRTVVQSSNVTASETTTSTSYADLATPGPSVTVDTGDRALVFYSAGIDHGTADALAVVSFEVSGSTTIAADDTYALFRDGFDLTQNCRWGGWFYFEGTLTPGSNTFKLKYKVGSGTGTFLRRLITVMPF